MAIRLLALLSTILIFTGCGTLKEHTEQAAVKTAGEFNETHEDQITKRSSIPPMRVGGWGNTVEIKPQAKEPVFETTSTSKGTTDASGTDSLATKAWSKYPLWIALIGTAVGIALLIGVFKWARASSPTVNAIVGTVDGEMSALVGKLESQLQTSTDPAQKLTLLSALNDANKTRGKIMAQAPPDKV